MQLHLGGHLGWYAPQRQSRLQIHLDEPVLLLSLLERLKIPAAEIAVAIVNKHAVDLDSAQVSDGDNVELFPPVGGGSVSYPKTSSVVGLLQAQPRVKSRESL